MERKRIYITPQSRIVQLRSVLMISGTNKVNDYTQGSDIMIGDKDDSTTARENIWGFTEED